MYAYYFEINYVENIQQQNQRIKNKYIKLNQIKLNQEYILIVQIVIYQLQQDENESKDIAFGSFPCTKTQNYILQREYLQQLLFNIQHESKIRISSLHHSGIVQLIIRKIIDVKGLSIREAIHKVDILKLVNNKTVRLHYPGAARIVVVKGIKKEATERMLREFKAHKVKKIMFTSGHTVLEAESEEIALLLKKHLRHSKRTLDLTSNDGYKTTLNSKVRIIIEGQELYTLLLDHLFERRFIILQQLNADDTIFIQPIVGQNYLDYNKRDQSESDRSEITSCSQVFSSRALAQVIQTNDTGTQFNEPLEECKKQTYEQIFQEENTFDKQNDQLLNAAKDSKISEDQIAETKEEQHIVDHQKVYSFQNLEDILDNMIDSNMLSKPNELQEHPEITKINGSYEHFLNNIYQKLAKNTRSFN